MSGEAEASWRSVDDTDTWIDFIKRAAMVSSFFISSAVTWYYLKRKRKNLKEKQKLYLAMCGLGYAAQVALKLFYIQRHRPVPMEECVGFVICTPLMYLLPAYLAKAEHGKLVTIKYVLGAFLYIFGLFIETKAEYDRKIFKDNPINKGKLYTIEWNAYSRNPNYFAEILIFSGWNMFTFNNYLICLESLLMAISFYTYHIPEKEEYLSNKYGGEWNSYSQKVKALIPFIL